MSHHHHHSEGSPHVCCGHHGENDPGCCGQHHHHPEPIPEPEIIPDLIPEPPGCAPSACSSCAGCSPQDLPGREGIVTQIMLTPEEAEFMEKLGQTPYLPLAEFFLTSSKEEELSNTVLAPVYLETGEESLQEIRALGKVLKSLEEKDLITLDYDQPLKHYDPALFLDSEAFRMLEETVEQGQELTGALFDTANLGIGSISLTHLGQVVVDQLDFC